MTLIVFGGDVETRCQRVSGRSWEEPGFEMKCVWLMFLGDYFSLCYCDFRFPSAIMATGVEFKMLFSDLM